MGELSEKYWNKNPASFGTRLEMDRNLEMSESDFKKMENPSADVNKEVEEYKDKLKVIYGNLIDIFKKYVDLEEDYYNIIALWTIGTYFHKQFPSYPFLFFNAMKGSGKSRTMNLITFMSKDGAVCNNMTEAVLFRTTGTLAIDEFEGINRKGNENLRELLNSCYKRGTKVKRMRQVKTMEGVRQEVEEFEVYRPVLLANIWGMENVLGDRCIQLVLDKSHRKEVTNLIEIFQTEPIVLETKKLLEECSLCSYVVSLEVYKEWNSYIVNNYTNNINYTNYTNNTKYTELFKTIKSMDLNGRELELSFPLCILAHQVSQKKLHKTTLTLKEIFNSKKEEEMAESHDINLIDFISQEVQNNNYISVNLLLQKFKESFAIHDEWVNTKWLGRALKRLNLVKQRRRNSRGVEVILNYTKAQEKIRMFK